MIYPQILLEDQWLLVLEKPAGWVVNRAQTVKKDTIQDWLEKNFFFPVFKFKECRSGIVHRLDKETSGILLVAKTPQSFFALQKQFKERQVKKKYLALVHGKLVPQFGSINVPISRSPFDRKKFGVFLGGRPAQTDYEVKKYYQKDDGEILTLVDLEPKTGRTHQIRVHLKYLGHPLVGDAFYAGRKTARADRRWCPRHFLHAYFLSFFHPQKENKIVKIKSPLPQDLKKVLNNLKEIKNDQN